MTELLTTYHINTHPTYPLKISKEEEKTGEKQGIEKFSQNQFNQELNEWKFDNIKMPKRYIVFSEY